MKPDWPRSVASIVLSGWYRARGFSVASLLVQVPGAEPAVRSFGVRSAGDVPPHVTIAYPFSLAAMGASATARLERLFAGHAAFDLELHAVGRFDDVAYLAPRESQQCAAMAEAVQEQFPGNPLYGGAFDSYIPHLSLGPLQGLTSATHTAVERLLPIRAHVQQVELWGQRQHRWVLVRAFTLAP